MRSEEEFEHILGEAKKVPGVVERGGEVRQRKVPRWMDDGEMMLTEGFQPERTHAPPKSEY